MLGGRASVRFPEELQGYLTCKKTHPPRTLPQAYVWGPRGVLGGRAFSYERGTLVESVSGSMFGTSHSFNILHPPQIARMHGPHACLAPSSRSDQACHAHTCSLLSQLSTRPIRLCRAWSQGPIKGRGVVGAQRAGRQSVFTAERGDDALAVVEALESQSLGVPSLSEMTQGGSQSSGSHFLAGITKTSTCVFHETDRVSGLKGSACVSSLTGLEGFCRGSLSGPERRTELRRKRDESLHAALGLPVLRVRRGLAGIWRNHDTGSMLWGLGQGRKWWEISLLIFWFWPL